MNLYIGDLHFGHANVIRFDNRPFKDRDEMDRTLIQNWNYRVQVDDDVYILGDLCYRAGNTPDWYLNQLRGRKHLVIGNHDWSIINDEKAMSYFETVDKIMTIKDGDYDVVLCHYPMAQWNGAHRGYWHIYAHIHSGRDDPYSYMVQKGTALNAGCMINNYMSVSFKELIANNKRFQDSHIDNSSYNEEEFYSLYP